MQVCLRNALAGLAVLLRDALNKRLLMCCTDAGFHRVFAVHAKLVTDLPPRNGDIDAGRV